MLFDKNDVFSSAVEGSGVLLGKHLFGEGIFQFGRRGMGYILKDIMVNRRFSPLAVERSDVLFASTS